MFVADAAEVVNDWHQPPRARKPQRHVRLTGELANGELSHDMYALYDPPAPEGWPMIGPSRLRVGGRARV